MGEKRIRKKKRGDPTDERWSDREVLDLLAALQHYGSADIKSIAKAVKSKSEESVEWFVTKEVKKARKRLFSGTRERVDDLRTLQTYLERGATWRSSRKWQVLAHRQVAPSSRAADYSCAILPKLLETFMQECRPLGPEEVDLHSMYRFLWTCMQGHNPASLPPKESFLFLMVLRLLKEMVGALDVQEEMQFLRRFQCATKFVPFKVKDEFRKKRSKGSGPARGVVESKSGAPEVLLPEPVYEAMIRHRRLIEANNPLTIPAWLIEKEQDFMNTMIPD